MIAVAAQKDIPEILEACKSFFNASQYGETSKFNERYVLETIHSLVHGKKEQGVILLSRNEQNECTGLLGALKSILPFSGESVACELVWWVYPEYRKGRHGLILFKAFEYWCEHIAKVKKIQVSNLDSINPDVMENIYKKFGYNKYETAWMKDI